mgnify:CR=1 FL=1
MDDRIVIQVPPGQQLRCHRPTVVYTVPPCRMFMGICYDCASPRFDFLKEGVTAYVMGPLCARARRTLYRVPGYLEREMRDRLDHPDARRCMCPDLDPTSADAAFAYAWKTLPLKGDSLTLTQRFFRAGWEAALAREAGKRLGDPP